MDFKQSLVTLILLNFYSLLRSSRNATSLIVESYSYSVSCLYSILKVPDIDDGERNEEREG